jgi:hypothetical protein
MSPVEFAIVCVAGLMGLVSLLVLIILTAADLIAHMDRSRRARETQERINRRLETRDDLEALYETPSYDGRGVR